MTCLRNGAGMSRTQAKLAARATPAGIRQGLMLLAALAVCSGGVRAAEPPPLRAFVAGAVNHNVRISPTGSHLAATMSIDDQSWFRIISYPENEIAASVDLGEDRGVANFWWVQDDLVLVASTRRAAGSDAMRATGELYTVDAGNGRMRPMPSGGVLNVNVDDPDHVLIARSADRFGELHRLNVNNGLTKRIARGAAPRGGFVLGPDGKVAFSSGVNEDNEQEIHYRIGQKWELVEKHGIDDAGWVPVWHGSKPDTWLTYDTRGRSSTSALGLYDRASGEHRTIIRHPHGDVTGLYHDFGGKRLWGVRFDHHYPAVQYIDKTHPLAVQHAMLAKMYPEDDVRFTSTTRDHTKAIAVVSGDRKPGDFILVDLEQRKLAPLMKRRPALSPDSLAPMAPVELKVRDGSTVYGYVTSPSGAPTPGPMVVLVHGGPYGIRDTWGYRTQVQILASRGLHVLQVNFRGSGGYGLDYQRAGFGEWGGRMQDDVTDATRWAIENGIADADRICVFGTSYGAYAALMGSAREPDLYACAIGMSGIYDMNLMAKVGDVRQRRSGERYLREILGTDPEELKARSPVNMADRIRAQVMLVHGGQDRRAPPAHANRMRSALADAGREIEWLYDGDQGHGFVGNQTVEALWQRILAFLDRSIGDGAAQSG